MRPLLKWSIPLTIYSHHTLKTNSGNGQVNGALMRPDWDSCESMQLLNWRDGESEAGRLTGSIHQWLSYQINGLRVARAAKLLSSKVCVQWSWTWKQGRVKRQIRRRKEVWGTRMSTQGPLFVWVWSTEYCYGTDKFHRMIDMWSWLLFHSPCLVFFTSKFKRNFE